MVKDPESIIWRIHEDAVLMRKEEFDFFCSLLDNKDKYIKNFIDSTKDKRQ